ncbi:hypothetical protein CBS101457_006242 [Exobasidium rhododendri]|nr:hypothetical protein CBS101457_006242 [Exobasidium rhododendri]
MIKPEKSSEDADLAPSQSRSIYISPISGFKDLLPEEVEEQSRLPQKHLHKYWRQDVNRIETLTHPQPTSHDQGGDVSSRLDSLGPSIQSSHEQADVLYRACSNGTLKVHSTRKSDDNDADWDETKDLAHESRSFTSGPPTQLPTSLPITPTHSLYNSNTWSALASSKVPRVVSQTLLKCRDKETVAAALVASHSTPSTSPSSLQNNTVSESWDEDFLFQEEEEEDKRTMNTLTIDAHSRGGKMLSEDLDDDEEEEDWNMALPNSISSRTIQAPTNRQQPSLFDHLERFDVSTRKRDLTAQECSMQIKESDPSSQRPSFSGLGDASPRQANSSASPSASPSEVAGGRRRSHRSLFGSGIETLQDGPEVEEELRRSPRIERGPSHLAKERDAAHRKVLMRHHTQDVSVKDMSSTQLSSTPSKRSSRLVDGHWSQFLSSRLSNPRSPEAQRKSHRGQVGRGNQGAEDSGSQTFNSTVSSPKSDAALSMHSSLQSPPPRSSSLLQPSDEAAVNVPSAAEGQRKFGHSRRAGSNLSLSFGMSAPWNKLSRSASRVDVAKASLPDAGASSVSLASIIADNGRLDDEPKGSSISSTTAAEARLRHGATEDSRPETKSSSSTLFPPVGAKRANSRGSKRKQSSVDLLPSPPRTNLPKVQNHQAEASGTARKIRTVPLRERGGGGVLEGTPRTPTLLREPLATLKHRSNSQFTSLERSIIASSDYTTSTASTTTSTDSATSESTLYGSLVGGDSISSSSPSHEKYNQISVANVKREIALLENKALDTEGKTVKRVPSVRRIRVSTNRSSAIQRKDEDEIPPNVMRSVTESQVRLGTLSTSIGSSRGSTVESSEIASADSLLRRRSWGDLKIPSRISKAQESIRANIERVRDFAVGIEELKGLQERYQILRDQIDEHELVRTQNEEEFSNWWECAEVLVGLGEGRGREDEEANVERTDRFKQSSPCGQREGEQEEASWTRQRSNGERSSTSIAGSSSAQYDQPTALRSGSSSARPASSRASSNRSIDPKREIDILAAMLAGTPVEGVSSIRKAALARERTMSASGVSQFGRSPPRSSSGSSSSNHHYNNDYQRQCEPQGQMRLAAISTTSLTFMDTPTVVRARRCDSQKRSPPSTTSNRKGFYRERGNFYQSNTASGTMSMESVNTQVSSRRTRLRSAGKAGLQGLRELLRTFRINSTALPSYQAGVGRSRLSLDRVDTSESRRTLDEDDRYNSERSLSHLHDGAAAVKEIIDARRLSRSRSLFAKSTSTSPISRRPPLMLIGGESQVACNTDTSTQRALESSRRRSSLILPAKGSTVDESRTIRQSSGTTSSSAKDTSLDSDWTNGDFDHLSIHDLDPSNSDSRPSSHHYDVQPLKTKLSRKRFSLFSKGFPSSASKRLSREQMKWNVAPSDGSADKVNRRQSLPVASKESSFGGLPRATSNSKHPLLLVDTEMHSTRKWGAARTVPVSSSTSSSSPSPSPSPNAALLFISRKAADRPSIGSTIASYRTDSSGGGGVSVPARSSINQEHSSFDSSSNPVESTISNLNFRKLALKPEAIPSLLLYLETTKERCQESLSLLASHSQ